MQTSAMTFRAEPDFFAALKAYADKLGVSMNSAMKDIIAPVVGIGKTRHVADRPLNDLGRFCGCLKDVDCCNLEAALADASKIDEEMWK